jgi:hypothetical protein
MNNYDGLTQCQKILKIMYDYIDSDREWYGKRFSTRTIFYRI